MNNKSIQSSKMKLAFLFLLICCLLSGVLGLRGLQQLIADVKGSEPSSSPGVYRIPLNNFKNVILNESGCHHIYIYIFSFFFFSGATFVILLFCALFSLSA